MGVVRLTPAQALVRFLAAQRALVDRVELPLFAGCWAIFGHGNVAGLGDLELVLQRARAADRTYIVVIDTDPMPTAGKGGASWDVAVPEASPRAQVGTARKACVEAQAAQAMG